MTQDGGALIGERVLVCGGRGYGNEERVFSVLDDVAKYRGILVVINGAAPGADGLSTAWACARYVPCLSFAADWKKHGTAAGPIRNQEMLEREKPTLVVAFPGGRGTADMVRRARVAGIEVMEVPDTSDRSIPLMRPSPLREWPDSSLVLVAKRALTRHLSGADSMEAHDRLTRLAHRLMAEERERPS